MNRVELVLAAACQADPSIDGSGAAIAARCIQMLDAEPALTAADLARSYLAEDRTADVSWVAHISRATVATGGASPQRGQ